MNSTLVFLWIKYRKVWSALLEHFIEHKPLIFMKSDAMVNHMAWKAYTLTSIVPKKCGIFLNNK